LSGTSSGSGLTPSLTELGVHAAGQAGDDHPSSSRYMDPSDTEFYHVNSHSVPRVIDVLAIPEETEQDVHRSQQHQQELQQYHLDNAAHTLLSDPVESLENEHFEGEEIEEAAPSVEQDDWLCLTREQAIEAQAQLEDVRATFVDEVDELDCTMVAEYADEIFGVMSRLEVRLRS
jgi:hypothetical protein